MDNSGDEMDISGRKTDHIRISLQENVNSRGVATGFDSYRFWHNALPELNFHDISLETSFMGKKLSAPLLISSMTGGSAAGGTINERLAEAAEARGWAMGVGSVRAAVEHGGLADTFAVRKFAPTIPVIANMGAVQLNYGYGPEECRRAVEITGADMLVLHLNSLQEVFQPEGDVNFADLLGKIEAVCGKLDVPVGVKEVGWGVDAATARRLHEIGVAFIDVAGAGGTSWSQVEKFRSADKLRREAAEAFADWGIPTAECLREVRSALPTLPLIGSGGLRTGVDAAKAVALGANLAGFGRVLLGPAVESADLVEDQLARVELELKIAMFGIGAGSVAELQNTTRLRKQP